MLIQCPHRHSSLSHSIVKRPASCWIEWKCDSIWPEICLSVSPISPSERRQSKGLAFWIRVRGEMTRRTKNRGARSTQSHGLIFYSFNKCWARRRYLCHVIYDDRKIETPTDIDGIESLVFMSWKNRFLLSHAKGSQTSWIGSPFFAWKLFNDSVPALKGMRFIFYLSLISQWSNRQKEFRCRWQQ